MSQEEYEQRYGIWIEAPDPPDEVTDRVYRLFAQWEQQYVMTRRPDEVMLNPEFYRSTLGAAGGILFEVSSLYRHRVDELFKFFADALGPQVRVTRASALHVSEVEPVAPGMLRIEPTEVENERGVRLPITRPFLVSRDCVTTAEFARFCHETGYVTTAEQQADQETYRSAVEGLSKRDVDTSAVTCVSFVDAQAYCRWAGGFLANEAQWLAASVVDWRVCATREECESRRKSLPADRTLRFPLYEWIAPDEPTNDHAFIRHGPKHVLEPDWRSRYGRKAEVLTYSEVVLSFRLCRSAGTDA